MKLVKSSQTGGNTSKHGAGNEDSNTRLIY